MSLWMRTTIAVMFLMAAIACGKGSSPTSPTPTTMSVSIVSGGFTPKSVDVSVGSTVTWMNNDSAAHSVVADGGAFSSGAIAPGGQYSYVFPTAGTFAYHDAGNVNMTGVVNVSGSSSPAPSPY
jgi:plastocyanin